MNLTDRPADVSFEDLTRQALAEKPIPNFILYEVVEALRPLPKKKTKGYFSFPVVLFHRVMDVGTRRYMEFIRALETFKQSGKKIIGYLHSPSQLDYLVYSACDELHYGPCVEQCC